MREAVRFKFRPQSDSVSF